MTVEQKLEAAFTGVGEDVRIDRLFSNELDQRIDSLHKDLEFRGEFDASSGAFPVGAARGYYYRTTTSGTVDGVTFVSGDLLIADAAAPSSSVFADNWFRVNFTPSAIRRINQVVKAFPSSDDLIATTAPLIPGDIYKAGEYQYEVAASGATDHHRTTAGGSKLYVVPLAGKYHAEAWGLPVTQTSFNKAFADVVTRVKGSALISSALDFQYTQVHEFVCSSEVEVSTALLTYDVGEIGGVPEAMGLSVDFSLMRIKPAVGAALSSTDFMMDLRVRNSTIKLPGRDGGDQCSGVIMDRCITSVIYGNNIGQRVADGGYDVAFARPVSASDITAGLWYRIKSQGTTDFTAIGAADNNPGTLFLSTGAGTGSGVVFGKGEMDNSVVHGLQNYEETLADEATARQGTGLYINAFDFSIYDYRGGWTKTPILIDPGAAEVSIIGPHPFNGRGLSGTITAPTDPTIIDSYSNGDIYIFAHGYLDNGIIHDRGQGDVHIISSHSLELDGSVVINGPRFRKYYNSGRADRQPGNRLINCESMSYGLYNEDGSLSTFGGDNDWDGDATAINSFWDEQEIPEAITRICRREIEVSHGIDDVPTKQFVKLGGRNIWQWEGSSGGVTSVVRNVFDPINGEQRLEAPRTAIPGVINYGSIHDVTISSGNIDLSGNNLRRVLRLTSESGSADELRTISGALTGDEVKLIAASGHVITLLNNNGSDPNFRLGGNDVVLNDGTETVDLYFDGFNWLVSSNSAKEQTFSTLNAGEIIGDAVQADATDATSGRLMTVGAFGLGGDSVSPPSFDLGLITESGLYNFDSATIDDGLPPLNGVLLHIQRDTDASVQVAFGRSSIDGRTFKRRKQNGIYSGWILSYDQETIVGTVSESSGVPTGAIIERGSNSNGQYVRFADGTQVCTTSSLHNSNLGADVTVSGQWDFPASFDGLPWFIGPSWRGTGGLTASENAAERLSASATIQDSAYTYWALANNSSVSVPAARLDLFAIGRWF